MVSTTRHTQQHSWDYDNRQQQIFIRQLRALYQRSLTMHTAVQTPEAPIINMPRLQQDLQVAGLPRGWGAPSAAAAMAPETDPATGAGGSTEDPCPNQNQNQRHSAGAAAGTAAAGADASMATVAAATAASAGAPTMWQLDQEEDDSEDEPPGMMEASRDREDGEEDEACEYGEDGDDAEMTDNEEEDEDAWDAAPAPAATNAIRHAWARAGRRAAAAAHQQQQQQQPLGFSAVVPLLAPEQWRRPGACSFLQRGVTFEGSQRLSTQLGARRREEQWAVSVVIQDVDLERGCVVGTMQARNVPGMEQPIETFWEGCIIDDVNNTFYTRAWGASKDTDLQHWAKFEGWPGIKAAVVQHSGRCGQLEQHPVIYMRWKEQFFVHSCQQDCGLTIAGFYYVALHRQTGRLQGFYYDPCSSPFQELNLRVYSDSSSSNSSGGSGGSCLAGAGCRHGRSSGSSSPRHAEQAAAATETGAGRADSGAATMGGLRFASYSFA